MQLHQIWGAMAYEPHPEPQKASFNDFVEDTLSILDFFNIEKVHNPKPSCQNVQLSHNQT